jgi:type I restriction enzyme, R subunit
LDNKSEAKTRTELIDPAIQKAGWNINDKSQVDIEIPVDGYNAEPWNGISDYILLRDNGEVLAVVEAKRTSIKPTLAQQQTEHYLTQIEKHQSFRPFGFMANGQEIYFYDMGQSAKRKVHGFFSKIDLERLLALRSDKKPLTSIPINSTITDRPYQIEGIKRIVEVLDKGKRKALLIMATGTGKTRTAMSIIDVFMRSGQALNILFVADRDALVRQAKTEGFEEHIPSEPCTRIFSTNISEAKSNRLFVATLQTMSTQYDKFNPGFFDLIVFDEVHRSIFNKYKVVMDYFDARMIGLTATPADFIDRSTFVAFDCFDGTPDYLYTYEQAIEEGYLVDYRLYRTKTLKQIQGIKSAYLTEEDRNALIQQGIDPDDINYEGTQLEKDVSNKDTLRQQWREFMDVAIKDASGKPCKTIVFAMTQDHALRLEEAFNEIYPQYVGMVKVITYKSEYKGQSINHLKQEDMPRIAISVDMLETGVNIPELMNLAFMRPVQSRIKIMQMMGRGTRTKDACKFPERLPNGEKDHFLILDFWENDFNRDADEAVAQSLPVAVSLFNTRLKLLENYLADQQSSEAQTLIASLRSQVSGIPKDAFEVKQILHLIEDVWNDHFWLYLTEENIRLLKNRVAPLLQYTANIDVAATTFTHKIERFKLATVENKKTDGLMKSIREDVSRLPGFVFEHKQKGETARLVLGQDLEQASLDQLTEIINRLAPEMRNRRANPDTLLVLDLADRVQLSGYVILNRTGEEVYVTDYRQRVEKRIIDLVNNHPTILSIQENEDITDEKLLELERTLRHELVESDLELTGTNLLKAYGSKSVSFLTLLRQVLELDATVVPDYQDIVKRQFEGYIQAQEIEFNSDQIRFLRTVASELAQRGRLDLADLYESPFINFGQDAVDRFFSKDEVTELLELTTALSA